MTNPAPEVHVDERLRRTIADHDWKGLRDALVELHPSDVADLVIALPPEEEAFVFRLLPKDRAGAVFSYLPPNHQEELIESLTNEQVRSVLQAMPADDRTRLLEEMPAEVTRRLLAALPPKDLKDARWLLGYPEHAAGRFMSPQYVTVRPDMTASEALAHIRKTGRGTEAVNVVYIVDDRGVLLEDVRLSSLVLADPEMLVGDIGDPPLVCVLATDDREEVLKAFEKYDRLALPVT
ncbi:MAG: magnesium transporter, partial [Thermoanaerobaculia bacterium]